MEMKHSKHGGIECRICGQHFVEKRQFMVHRKNNHNDAVAFCRNESEGRCIFSSEKCWWKHDEANMVQIECFN